MCFDVAASIYLESLCDTSPIDQAPFLSDVSTSDKPWDTHKAQAVQVAEILAQGYSVHQRQSQRMRECAQSLEFACVIEDIGTGLVRLKLKSARFCRVRHCPICQWRRALMWVSRFYHTFPKIYADHPEWRYIMLTFTVRNCRVLDLRKTIKSMNEAWQRLTQRKVWPAIGFIRSLEITRGDDGSAHPHFHCLLAVKPSYFGKNYLSTAKWAELWREALRIDYTPICDVRIVKPKDYSESRGKTVWKANPEQENYELKLDGVRNGVFEESFKGIRYYDDLHDALVPSKAEILLSAITEVIKYVVKPDDMVRDPLWLIELSSQLRGSRAVALGGELRKYLSEKEPENLVTESTEELAENDGGIHFGWREQLERYQRK